MVVGCDKKVCFRSWVFRKFVLGKLKENARVRIRMDDK